MPSNSDLPPAVPAMWRTVRRGFQAEPRLLLISLALALLAALPDAILALLFKFLADGVVARRPALVMGASAGLAVSAAATWFLGVLSQRVQRQFRDRMTVVLESHVAELQATVSTLEHHERPDYLDRLEVLRTQVFVLDHIYMSLFSTGGWILRLAVTLSLLMSVSPWLALLVLFALPTVLMATWRPDVENRAQQQGAPFSRLARHLFQLATTAPPGKEVRVTGIGPRLVTERRRSLARWYAPVARARLGSALWYAAGWAIFGAAYVGAVVFVTASLRATPGQVLLVLAAGSRLSAYIGATVGEIGFLRGIWLDGSQRLAWLEDYAAAQTEGATAKAPSRLTEGIRLEHVSFAYPGTDRLVLDGVDLRLPAGAVVAIVGENGAGKSTLVKLLCQLYAPTSGRILVDGVDMAAIARESWRARLAGAFQDFYRFELKAAYAVGLGELTLLDDSRAVAAAVDRAGAGDVVQRLDRGLETQLGAAWPEGAELSFGQWQKLALARGFMRERPLLLILDEPTAALDAETEHALFERFASAAKAGQSGREDGRITVLVSHRFSTVRMADLIVVLDGARVVECGAHDELLGRRGPYAELYEIQAAAYR